MRRLLISLAAAFSFILIAPVFPASAAPATTIPCYCRYAAAPAGDWLPENTRYCNDETEVQGLVPRSTAVTSCQSLCQDAGLRYVGVSNVDPEGFDRHPLDMMAKERDYCVFSDGPLPTDDSYTRYATWSEANNNCRQPLNSTVTTTEIIDPPSCSSCFCKIKTNAQTGNCGGKTVFVHTTSSPSTCPALCEMMGLDSDGPAAGSYGQKCDYRSSQNDCSKPLNADSPGCASILNQGYNANASAIGDAFTGSVLTLPLPLSDVTLPQVIAGIIRTILSIVGALALALFVWGGLQWMLAAGDSKKIDAAKGTIKAAVIGLIVIFSSYAVLNFIINALTK